MTRRSAIGVLLALVMCVIFWRVLTWRYRGVYLESDGCTGYSEIQKVLAGWQMESGARDRVNVLIGQPLSPNVVFIIDRGASMKSSARRVKIESHDEISLALNELDWAELNQVFDNFGLWSRSSKLLGASYIIDARVGGRHKLICSGEFMSVLDMDLYLRKLADRIDGTPSTPRPRCPFGDCPAQWKVGDVLRDWCTPVVKAVRGNRHCVSEIKRHRSVIIGEAYGGMTELAFDQDGMLEIVTDHGNDVDVPSAQCEAKTWEHVVCDADGGSKRPIDGSSPDK